MTDVVTGPKRWWIYQRERFPLLAHGPLIAAFSFSALAYANLLRGAERPPTWTAALVAFITVLIFFLQLRIADEFKDFAEDSRYRPYRPVPRGLVSLKELALVAAAGAVVQLGLALWLHPPLLIVLLVAWLYLALMTKEFFCRAWLEQRPITYLWTHMLIMPLVDLYATACDWLLAGGGPPLGLQWFLAVSFFNGVVIEIGRKLRAPADEEEGVKTYTALYGPRQAVIAWCGALVATALCAWQAARLIQFETVVVAVLLVLLAAAALVGLRFVQQPEPARARFFEPLSGLWTLTMYLTLGALPLWLHYSGGAA